jgi:glyoxylase-like metal-dependent hydrolase (beta-lactamase superfamily II)
VRVSLLTAGWTTHPAGVARRGAGRAPVRFPALVAVVEHADGVALLDTGYAPRVRAAVSRGLDRVYGALLPVHVTPEESAAAQLAARGIAPGDVTTVVLTHLHADHVGGLRDFPAARVVADPAGVALARSARGFGRLRRGLVPALLPHDLGDRLVDPRTLADGDHPELTPLAGARDLLGDGRLLVVPLPGHATGHLGLVVRLPDLDLVLVGDAAWHARAVSHGELPHPVARAVTADWTGYRGTLGALADLARRRSDVLVLPSHDADAIAAARAALAR